MPGIFSPIVRSFLGMAYAACLKILCSARGHLQLQDSLCDICKLECGLEPWKKLLLGSACGLGISGVMTQILAHADNIAIWTNLIPHCISQNSLAFHYQLSIIVQDL